MRVTVADHDVERHGLQQCGAKRVGVGGARARDASYSLQSGSVSVELCGAVVFRPWADAQRLAEVLLMQAFTGWAAIVAGDDDRLAGFEFRQSGLRGAQPGGAPRVMPSPRSG